MDTLLNSKEINNQIKELEIISDILQEARDHDLEEEVVCWSLLAMQADPTLTPAQAILQGSEEWIK